MKHALILITVVVFILMAGCKGPAGPTGATGAQGPTGPQGPTGSAGQDFTYWSGSKVVAANGTAAVNLPIGAGSLAVAPLINCYIGDGSGTWLLLGTDVSPGGATAGIGWNGTRWVAAVIGAPSGWIFWVNAAW